MEIISRYTIQDATEDGVLIDLETVCQGWGNGVFSHITPNLLDKFRSLRLLAATLNQIQSKMLETRDSFYSIRAFNGIDSFDVYSALNETGKFTVMLPEDY